MSRRSGWTHTTIGSGTDDSAGTAQALAGLANARRGKTVDSLLPRLKTWDPGAGSRPLAFFVSLAAPGRNGERAADPAGEPYERVCEALVPLLGQLGSVTFLDHPESRLAYAAARARADGFRPIQLVLKPPPESYFTPEVPTVLFALWAYPTIPNRAIGGDTRQNWSRICRPASLILTSCHAAAGALKRAGLANPIAVVPIPLGPEEFEVPPWKPVARISFPCRHAAWGGPRASHDTPGERAAARSSAGGRAWQIARKMFRRIHPWLNPDAVDLVDRTRTLGRRLAARTRLKRTRGRSTVALSDPRPPADRLSLSQLVYTSVLDPFDPRSNSEAVVTAFVSAFRGRPDATLVIALERPDRAAQAVERVRTTYQKLPAHECRVVVIAEPLDAGRRRALLRATTYYVSASHADATGLSVRQALAAGRPALAPRHSALADCLDDAVGFVVRSHPEPTCWPHDPEERLETTWERVGWADLHDRLLESARSIDHDRAGYQALCEAARTRMARHAGQFTALEALRQALAQLPEHAPWSCSWAS